MFTDTAVLVERNLLTVKRIPTLLISATIQPLMFVFLFAYVFGATFGGSSYREFLMAGIFTQTVVFNAAFTTVGLANDTSDGIIDRLRSLPMTRLGVISGRVTSDMLLGAVGLAVMVACGLAIGWRIYGSAADAAIAFGIIGLFAIAMAWVGAVSGLAAPNVEAAQSIGFLWMFPVTFLSSAFISAQSLPGPLRTIAEWNPVTAVATACRQLFGNEAPPMFPTATGWVADHAVGYAVGSSLVILAACVPVSLVLYRRSANR
ncbi:ABC transporter permease [Gordonia rubripertincta]|uniref:Transport permease protein n=2 Tax=Gordonia rubripertincta TaxID=36822 RepID=A0AAW6R7H9_GORRU|nr:MULTISPECIES: ABC transporter permease [Gordonia]ASR04545.1 Daunorubicin/doxorubicin resistance ABC transporter permease protein DrrB [Gordonia rubripertincta]MBM7277048.1 ABC transporter permease [Gordonia rubripertincta]MDG6781853.1 ABC transporter permease [Gordonia rubripertincta]NKY64885.1 ABC transporter permease [Gordonia rubripertincta]QMU20932.1 ABC transporter permease [Gordonia rubripertincta]